MRLLLSFMIKVLDPLKISFPLEINNPLEIAQLFIGGEKSLEEYQQACELCWKYVDDRGALREFGKEDILLARLGICLLSTNKDPSDAGEKLAWFFEILDYLKIDTGAAERLMAEYFAFQNDE